MPNFTDFQEDLWQTIVAGGILVNPTPQIRDAYFATPRHMFLKRYRPHTSKNWRLISEGDPAEHLASIYVDDAIVLAGESDFNFLSTCSQPSYILNLVQRLGIRPGDRVLEIGSGCGWLLAVMSRLAGPEGHVTGVEIIPELAEQSRANLADYSNVTVHAGDGNAGFPGNAPYDRVIFTSGMHDLPAAFYDQIRKGGFLLVPVRMTGHGNVIYLLEHDQHGFVSRWATDGYFVPMQGQPAGGDILALRDVPYWPALERYPLKRQRMWWGSSIPGQEMQHSAAFRAFLKMAEPTARGFDLGGAGGESLQDNFAFGIVEEGTAAFICKDGLSAWGNETAFKRVLAALHQWTKLGMPPGSAFGLRISLGKDSAAADEADYAQSRGESVFAWKLRQG